MNSNDRQIAPAAACAALPRPRWSPALGWVASACLLLAGCGGGGSGGGAAAGTAAPLGLVKLTVSDSFGAPVAGAQVQGPRETSATDAQGVALVSLNAPDSNATVALSSASFADQTVAVNSSDGRVNAVAIIVMLMSGLMISNAHPRLYWGQFGANLDKPCST